MCKNFINKIEYNNVNVSTLLYSIILIIMTTIIHTEIYININSFSSEMTEGEYNDKLEVIQNILKINNLHELCDKLDNIFENTICLPIKNMMIDSNIFDFLVKIKNIINELYENNFSLDIFNGSYFTYYSNEKFENGVFHIIPCISVELINCNDFLPNVTDKTYEWNHFIE